MERSKTMFMRLKKMVEEDVRKRTVNSKTELFRDVTWRTKVWESDSFVVVFAERYPEGATAHILDKRKRTWGRAVDLRGFD